MKGGKKRGRGPMQNREWVGAVTQSGKDEKTCPLRAKMRGEQPFEKDGKRSEKSSHKCPEANHKNERKAIRAMEGKQISQKKKVN